MSTVVDRMMPHHLDAECSILGAVILDNLRLGDACEYVTPARFYRAAHRQIFAAMLELAERRDVIDPVTLAAELERAGHLEDVGGRAYLTALVDGVPRGLNVPEYARIVREKADLRDLILAGNRMIAKAYEAREDAAEVLEEAEQAILGLADGTVSTGFESMRSIAARGMELLEVTCQAKQAVTGVPSGFPDLDDVTRGFQPGTLVILGARPGAGKSSLAMNIAQHAASTGRVVGVFSLEMSNDELFMRQLASTAEMDSHRLQSGYIGQGDWRRIAAAIGTLSESSLYIDETPAIGVFQVRSRARRLKAEHGLHLLVIDYLQLMGSSDRRDSRALELGAITSALKALSKELKIPILALSQLSRETEKRERDHRPRLSDLRDSGSLEQDADIVLFIYRPEMYLQDDDNRGVAEILIAKHRNGPVGSVKLSWVEQQTRFHPYVAPSRPLEDQRLPIGDR